MPKILFTVLFLMAAAVASGELCRAPSGSATGNDPKLFDQMDAMLDAVRDNTISRQVAQTELQRLMPLLSDRYYRFGGKGYPASAWVFPLAGYGPKAVPGRKGKGFVVDGYDFFTGNRHGGHPAYDIFIKDSNQDELDDRTLQPVGVLSMTGGVVVSAETEWSPASKLRGGKYIWIYDPANDLLVYYAHNREVLVKAGDLVRPGDLLARVGRSGFNAAKKRSPTHLHMTVLKANQGDPKAVRFWEQLKKTKTIDCQ
jgi:murein DD-endopeptidase MepM/ murein hydrolase activator NlpD